MRSAVNTEKAYMYVRRLKRSGKSAMYPVSDFPLYNWERGKGVNPFGNTRGGRRRERENEQPIHR